MNAAQPYVDSIKAVESSQSARRSRFAAIQSTWNRFYELSDAIGRDRAIEALPDEAEIVDEFERSAPDSNALWDLVAESLNRSLEMRIRELAKASCERADISIIGRLRQDLKALEEFRKANLDGINGRFWDVVRQGHGVDRKEKGRMINRILAAWCAVYEIKPEVMHQAALPFSAIPDYEVSDPASYLASFAAISRNYPFDIAADMAEARDWPEADTGVADALLEHIRQHGDLSGLIPSRCSRF